MRSAGASAREPLANRSRVSLRELHEHVELSVQDSSARSDDQHMFGGERVFYLSGFIAKKQALRMGVGFGWMPRYLVNRELRSGALREVRYSGGSRYSFTPQLMHRVNAPLGRTGTRLVELLIAGSPRAPRGTRKQYKSRSVLAGAQPKDR